MLYYLNYFVGRARQVLVLACAGTAAGVDLQIAETAA